MADRADPRHRKLDDARAVYISATNCLNDHEWSSEIERLQAARAATHSPQG
jgi:hypothetical protein